MNTENPFSKIISNPASIDEAVAELLRNENPEEPKSPNLRIMILFMWHLFLSGLIAMIVFYFADISDVAAAIIFTGCMIHSLHRGIYSLLVESRNQTIAQVNIGNALKACALSIHKQGR